MKNKKTDAVSTAIIACSYPVVESYCKIFVNFINFSKSFFFKKSDPLKKTC